jgi:hypothetical protein
MRRKTRCVVWIVLLAAAPALAGEVLLSDFHGTGRIYREDVQYGQPFAVMASLDVSAPDQGKLEKHWGSTAGGELQWSFANGASAARFSVDLNAQPDNNDIDGGADVVLSFTNDVPLRFRLLTVPHDPWSTGRGILGRMDDKELFMPLPYDLPELDRLETAGTLAPGSHTFIARGESTLFKIGAHVDVIGQVTLDLTPAHASAVPLPAGIWPGMAGLICVASWRASSARLYGASGSR